MNKNVLLMNAAIHFYMLFPDTNETEVFISDIKHKAGTLESLHYHDDYLWIMPVVEMIMNCSDEIELNCDQGVASCEITIYGSDGKYLEVFYKQGYDSIIEVLHDTIYDYVERYFLENISNPYYKKIQSVLENLCE